MRPPKPLPTEAPFLSLYTPTFRRPAALAANLASVGRQTAAEAIEQIVIPDHAGYGLVGGLYGRLPWYARALRGDYVNILCDDDTLADEKVVAQLQTFVERQKRPPVIVVKVIKNGLALPLGDPIGQPVPGHVDLTSYIVRRDLWLEYIPSYGLRYEGDCDHATALWNAGHRPVFCDLLWAIGGARHGRPEMDY